MRTVDQEGHEVQSPDLELGHLEPGKVLVQHHEAVAGTDAVYEDQLVEQYDNGGKLYKHVCVSPAVPAQDAYDEYEDVMVYVPYTKEELEEIAQQKQEQQEAEEQARQEAQKAQEERTATKRMNLAVRTVSRMMMSTIDLSESTDASVASLSPLYPEWDENGHEYKKGTPFYYERDGETKYFRCSQDVTSSNVYKPGDTGTESLYYEIHVAKDGVLVWHDVLGEYNSYNTGDRVHYPDESGAVYESKVDGNAYNPDTVPDNWTKVSD